MYLDRFSLAGRTALVTGASSGLGREFAKGLAQAGGTVVVAARRADRLDSLVAEIKQSGAEAVAVPMDVASLASIAEGFDQADGLVPTIDLVVNNAGISGVKPFLESERTDFDRVLDTNLGGLWSVAHEASKRMVAAEKPGSIVNISSLFAFGVQRGYSAYATSKAAVVQVTRAMAVDLARYGIRVNAIAPGWFPTEMNEDYLNSDEAKAYLRSLPMRRPGRIEELIPALLLLGSDAGSFINGSVLVVDGGQHAILH